MLQTHVVAILDDDAPVREALAELLEVAGIAAQTFDSPKAFLSVYDLSRFACVITDVKLPGISGIELLEHLRALHDDVRSEEHTSELQSLMRISYAVFCLKKKKQ